MMLTRELWMRLDRARSVTERVDVLQDAIDQSGGKMSVRLSDHEARLQAMAHRMDAIEAENARLRNDAAPVIPPLEWYLETHECVRQRDRRDKALRESVG